jgi:hypothetical protein
MVEPADARFFKFLSAERFRLLNTNAANTVDGFATIVEAALFKFLLGCGRRADCAIDVGENTLSDRSPHGRLGVAVGLTGPHLA